MAMIPECLKEKGRRVCKFLGERASSVERVRAYISPLVEDVMGYKSLPARLDRIREIIDSETEVIRRRVSVAIRNSQRKSKSGHR